MRDPKEFPEQLLADLRELLEDQDADDVVPILITMACGCAAQDGVNRKYLTKYILEIIDDAYAMFTRDENEAVH